MMGRRTTWPRGSKFRAARVTIAEFVRLWPAFPFEATSCILLHPDSRPPYGIHTEEERSFYDVATCSFLPDDRVMFRADQHGHDQRDHHRRAGRPDRRFRGDR